MAKIFIEIVDASVIDEPSAGVENRRLWRNLRLTLFHQNMLRVAKRRKGVAEFTIVLANGVGRFLLVRINQKECRVVAMLRAELLNRRSVAVGNGAVRAYKDEHNDFAPARVRQIEGFALKISG